MPSPWQVVLQESSGSGLWGPSRSFVGPRTEVVFHFKILCSHHLEVLGNFLIRSPHFHFVVGLTNYQTGPGPRLSEMVAFVSASF